MTGGGEMRLSIDEQFIYGFVTVSPNEKLLIEPLNYWISDAPKDVFIVYKSSDYIQTHPLYCADTTHPSTAPPFPMLTENRQAGECTEIELAFVADYLLCRKKVRRQG